MKKLAYFAMAAVFLFSAVLVTNSLAWDQEGGPWHHKFCRNNSVPSPTVTRPTWTSDKIGDVSKNYPFFSPYADLADYGYIQEEFFIEGSSQSLQHSGCYKQGASSTVAIHTKPELSSAGPSHPKTSTGRSCSNGRMLQPATISMPIGYPGSILCGQVTFG